jgi:hypothetical protein
VIICCLNLAANGHHMASVAAQELLDACGRAHGVDDILRALEAVHSASFPSWSLDLISGLPHLTPQLWQQSLDAAVAAQPPHMSVYDLQVKAGGAQQCKQCCKLPVGHGCCHVCILITSSLTQPGVMSVVAGTCTN